MGNIDGEQNISGGEIQLRGSNKYRRKSKYSGYMLSMAIFVTMPQYIKRDIFKIPNLTSENYNSWSRTARRVLKSKGIRNNADASVPHPEAAADVPKWELNRAKSL